MTSAKSVFTETVTLQLIPLVKIRRPLWDESLPAEERDHMVLTRLWQEIGELLKVRTPLLMAHWSCLKDDYFDNKPMKDTWRSSLDFLNQTKNKNSDIPTSNQTIYKNVDTNQTCGEKNKNKRLHEDTIDCSFSEEGFNFQPKKIKLAIFDVHGLDLYDSETFLDKLVAQNGIDSIAKESMNLICKKKSKRSKGLFHVIIEMESWAYLQIIDKKVLNIGCKCCNFVKSNVGINLCSKCCEFGHTIDVCPNDYSFCGYCSANHDSSRCKFDRKLCINCKRASKEFHLAINTNHSAFDKECFLYKRKLEETEYEECVNLIMTKE